MNCDKCGKKQEKEEYTLIRKNGKLLLLCPKCLKENK